MNNKASTYQYQKTHSFRETSLPRWNRGIIDSCECIIKSKLHVVR